MTTQESVAQPGTRLRGLRRPVVARPTLWLLVLAIGFAVQVGWRLHLSLPLTGPIAHGDEDGYLLGARVLAAGPTATLPAWSIMRPMGYPLLIAPVYWFVRQPSQVYIGVHIVNAFLMALNFPLLYLLGRRLFSCGRMWSAAVAFVLATLPSLVFFSQFALTDALLPELLLVILLAVHAMVTGRRPLRYGALGGAVAAYAANTHVRGLVMLVVLAGVVAVGLWRRWITHSTALATSIAALVVFLVTRKINDWLEAQLFPTGAVTVDDRVLTRLTSVRGLFRVVADGSGQIWHLCTSTYGLAGIGLAATIVILVRREGPRSTRIVLGAALVMNAGIALATAAGIPDEGRVNNHVYGRYVAMFAGLWSLVAVVALARASWRRATLLVVGGSAIVFATFAIVELYAHNRLPRERYVNFDAPELSFLSGDFRHLHIYRMTALAGVFIVAFALCLTGWRAARAWDTRATRVRRGLAFAALVGTLVLNLVAMVSITNSITNAWAAEQYHPGPAQLVRDAHIVVGSTIAEASNLPWNINQRHQLEVFWRPLVGFDPSSEPPPGQPEYVIALTGSRTVTGWDGRLHGYQVSFRYKESANITWVVWRHPE